MDKLSEVRVPPEWEDALIASLDRAPARTRGHGRIRALGLALVLAGIAGIAVWFGH